MTARVLVTGGSGFVGRWAVAALAAQGAEVHLLGRRAPLQNGVAWHSADLMDRAACRSAVAQVRPTHLLHAAWFVEHGAFWASPANLDWVGATLDLARMVAEAGTTRIVGVGTCVEYDWSDGGGQPRREDDPLRPVHLYGAAKAATAAVLERFAESSGLSFAWGRLFHLFGPGEDPRRLVGSLLSALREARPAELGSGRPVRDFLATQDAGAALAALTLGGVTGAVNVASGEGVSIAALARELAGVAGRNDLLRLGARPDPAGEIPSMVADVGRLRNEVDYTPAASRTERLRELWGQAEEATSA